jgi:uroporphyrinogen-III synthase
VSRSDETVSGASAAERTGGSAAGRPGGAGGDDRLKTRPGVVVTRDEEPGGPLASLLRARGFEVLHWPTIRIAGPADPAPLERALAELETFDWIVFTSPRAVAAVADRVGGKPQETGLRAAAVGRQTAGAAREAGWPVDLVPGVQTGDALLRALLDAGVGSGTRVFLPVSAIARAVLPDGLAGAGATVVRVEAYRTEAATLDSGECRRALQSGAAGILTFTSPSTVQNLLATLEPDVADLARARARAVAIGPTTAAAVRDAGFDAVVADPHSLEGLAERVAGLAAPTGIEEA